LAFVAALLWQAGDFSALGGTPVTIAEPRHLKYERSLILPQGASGGACAVLDGNVYAHSASWREGDWRIFRADRTETQVEIPFAVSYSEAQPTDAVNATVQNLRMNGGEITFDLAMPQRTYTIVELQLAAQNFIASAEVSGSDGRGGAAKSLGSFALFDLTQEHLARSTSLNLQESRFARLHIRLRVHSVDGSAFPQLSEALVHGATVPASREAQTLYTVVAITSRIHEQGALTVAQMDVPAHVPIERANFVLDPAYKSDFLRDVVIRAHSASQDLSLPQEEIDGQIWRVIREPGSSGNPATHAAKLSVPGVFASSLREPATVRVEVKNGREVPLPLLAVQLEMRQRTICFEAAAGSSYTLRYGDDNLQAPVYDFSGLKKMPDKPIVAVLGTEELNPDYVVRSNRKTYEERNPELYWIALSAAIAVLGAFFSRHTKRQRRRG
jgi:hypothetical protein